MKRSLGQTLIEIFLPIFLLLVAYLIRLSFKREKMSFSDEGSMEHFISDKSVMSFPFDKLNETMTKFIGAVLLFNNYTTMDFQDFTDTQIQEFNAFLSLLEQRSPDFENITDMKMARWAFIDKAGGAHEGIIPLYKGFAIKPLFSTICYNRFHIAYVGDLFEEEEPSFQACNSDSLLCEIAHTSQLLDGQLFFPNFTFHRFESIDDMNAYITAEDFGEESKPSLCFGISGFKKNKTENDTDSEAESYDIKFHYFDNMAFEGK